jgi:ATP-dependent Clp protease adaptor protein ClpS
MVWATLIEDSPFAERPLSDKTKKGTGGEEQLLTDDRVKQPRKFKVVLLNDDYTSMEFVIHVLQSVFRHGQASATRVMLHIHRTGVGVAGVYTREIAETRLGQVHGLAREAGHPLQCVMEPE